MGLALAESAVHEVPSGLMGRRDQVGGLDLVGWLECAEGGLVDLDNCSSGRLFEGSVAVLGQNVRRDAFHGGLLVGWREGVLV